MINSPSFLGYTRLGAETTAAKTDLREVRTTPNGPKTFANKASNLILAPPESSRGLRRIHSGSDSKGPTRYIEVGMIDEKPHSNNETVS